MHVRFESLICLGSIHWCVGVSTRIESLHSWRLCVRSTEWFLCHYSQCLPHKAVICSRCRSSLVHIYRV